MNSPFALALVSLLRNGAGEDGVLTIPEVERQLPLTLRAKLDEFEAAWKESDKAFVFIEKDFVARPPRQLAR